jgi:hypothetical protein
MRAGWKIGRHPTNRRSVVDGQVDGTEVSDAQKLKGLEDEKSAPETPGSRPQFRQGSSASVDSEKR